MTHKIEKLGRDARRYWTIDAVIETLPLADPKTETALLTAAPWAYDDDAHTFEGLPARGRSLETVWSKLPQTARDDIQRAYWREEMRAKLYSDARARGLEPGAASADATAALARLENK